MEAASPRTSIRVGIDLGSTTFRVAYVHPGTEKAVVSVPLTLEQFRPCFPIAEQLPSNDLYVPRFFPGLLQRLQPQFELSLFGKHHRTRDIAAQLLSKAVVEAQKFAGREIDGLLLCHPIGIDAEARTGLREALSTAGLAGGLTSDAEAACSFFRATDMREDQHATVLVFSAGFIGLGIAAARITPRSVRVLAKTGDPGVLGGNVLDFAIMQGAMRCLEEGHVLFADGAQPQRWSSFQYQVELAKHAIRDGQGAEFSIPDALTPSATQAVRMFVSGPAFRALVNQHLDRALAMVSALLEDTGVQEKDLEYILFLGGTTHLPEVAQRLQARFGAAKLQHLPPEAVASGGALLAMEPNLESIDRDPFTLASSEPFLPDMREVAGLVALAGGASARPAPDAPAVAPSSPAVAPSSPAAAERAAAPAAPAPPPPAPHAPHAPAVPEAAVETLTLAALRARIDQGDTQAAVRDLVRLQRAVEQELDRLRPRAVPLTSTN
jgi:molecular chaperone DnaK (HSP70)